jgi:hypothetical protein
MYFDDDIASDSFSIRVTSFPVGATELLWLRHQALSSAAPDLPNIEASPIRTVREGPPALNAEWRRLWQLSLEQVRAAQVADPASLRERPELWEAVGGSALAELIGIDLAPASTWRSSLASNDDAEESIMAVLPSAWRRGLRVIIELPFMGSYDRAFASDTLIVSTKTRSDPAAYAAAIDRHE